MLNLPKTDRIYHLPIDFEPNGIPFGATYQSVQPNYKPNLVWINKTGKTFLRVRDKQIGMYNVQGFNDSIKALYSWRLPMATDLGQLEVNFCMLKYGI